MRIFLTGGTGFIGSYFINAAIEAGYEVTALRRIDSKPKINLVKQPHWINKSLESVNQNDLACHDMLVHFAASGVSPQPATWQDCFDINVLQAIKLFENAKNAGIKYFLATGTYAEYGSNALLYDFIPPNAALAPLEPYAASKAAFYQFMQAFIKSENLCGLYERVFSVYGEGQYLGNFWPQLKAAASSGKDFPMTAGEQIRDFIHVEEAVQLMIHEISKAKNHWIKGSLITKNLASGEPISLRAFAENWWSIWKTGGTLLFGAIPYRENEVMRFVPEVYK
jgi:nucleoside-diphosphate-sugar epimerase